MPLAETGGALAAVTEVLRARLLVRLGTLLTDVTVGRPEPDGILNNPRLNLFLFEIQLDGHLKNIALDEGGPFPLWLVARYLLTAFDGFGDSDSVEAHGLLGEGIRALHELNFFPPPGASNPALDDSPDMLKLTFDEATPELLSRLMQGPDEHYRCSVAFQVRPVMIVPAEPPAYSLLVGIDYTAGGAIVPPEQAIQLPVLPSLGPRLASVTPSRFVVGDTLALRGSDLHLSGLEVRLGPATLTIQERRPDRLSVVVPAGIAGGAIMSAGTWPLRVVRVLPGGRTRSSNVLLAGLLPTLTAAAHAGRSVDADGNDLRDVDLTGTLLGTATDDTLVALYRDGVVAGPFDQVGDVPPPPPPPPVIPQTRRRVRVPLAPALPAADYRVIVRVNGQQARHSPTVTINP